MPKTPLARIAESLWGDADENAVSSIIKGDDRLTSEQRLSIYQGSVRSILINTLKSTFPVCEQLVGSEFFNAMAARFIKDKPSIDFDLDAYGEGFADFILSFSPAKQIPYLADVARLEWYWQQAILAPVSEPIDVVILNESIMDSHCHETIFKPPKYIAYLASSYPINKIWAMHQKEDAELVSLDEGGVQLVIFRTSIPLIISLTPEQWHLMNALRRGLCFEALLCDFEQCYSADKFADNFASLCKQGLITQDPQQTFHSR